MQKKATKSYKKYKHDIEAIASYSRRQMHKREKSNNKNDSTKQCSILTNMNIYLNQSTYIEIEGYYMWENNSNNNDMKNENSDAKDMCWSNSSTYINNSNN